MPFGNITYDLLLLLLPLEEFDPDVNSKAGGAQ
jgi:hypothetical protein